MPSRGVLLQEEIASTTLPESPARLFAHRDRTPRWQQEPFSPRKGAQSKPLVVTIGVDPSVQSRAGTDSVERVVATAEAIQIVDAGVVGRKAVAAQDLTAGTIINEFREPVFDHPTMHTVCLSESVHVAPTEGAEFISHACADTNCRIVVSSDGKVGRVTVTKPVRKGEDFSFNYNTTEWRMSCPFTCVCSSCSKLEAPRLVAGFANLSREERIRIQSETSPYVRRLAEVEEESEAHAKR